MRGEEFIIYDPNLTNDCSDHLYISESEPWTTAHKGGEKKKKKKKKKKLSYYHSGGNPNLIYWFWYHVSTNPFWPIMRRALSLFLIR